MLEIVVFLRAFVVSASALVLWEAAVLPVGVENKSNVDIDNHDDRRDHKQNLQHAPRQDWALVQVGLAVGLVLFVSFVAFLLRLVLRLGPSKCLNPPLRYPAELLGKHHVVNENVAISEEVDHENQRDSNAKHEKGEEAVECGILENHHHERHDHCDLGAEPKEIECCVLFKQAQNHSHCHDLNARLRGEEPAAAVVLLVPLAPLSNIVIVLYELLHGLSWFLHLINYLIIKMTS